jgi:hypothetical protein
MYKQVEKELSEIKKPEEDRLKKAFERLDVDRDGKLEPSFPCRANCKKGLLVCVSQIHTF